MAWNAQCIFHKKSFFIRLHIQCDIMQCFFHETCHFNEEASSISITFSVLSERNVQKTFLTYWCGEKHEEKQLLLPMEWTTQINQNEHNNSKQKPKSVKQKHVIMCVIVRRMKTTSRAWKSISVFINKTHHTGMCHNEMGLWMTPMNAIPLVIRQF